MPTPATTITVIGSVNVDYVMRVPTLPQAGETLTGSAFAVTLGGKGANQAVACARLGGDTHFIACVGDDDGGRRAMTAFRQDALNVGAIEIIAGASTGSAMIFVDDAGENCIGINAGANTHLDIEVINACEPLITSAGFVLMQLETPVDALVHAASMAQRHGARVILNPAPAVDTLPADLLAHVDILTPNQTEAATLTGHPVDSIADAERAARSLHALGPATVIVTLGADGALISEQGRSEHVPGQPVSVIDTVAAGDTFNGALAVALAEGQALPAAVRFANAAAAIAVTRRGAQDSIPARDEVRRAMDIQ